MDRNQLLQCSYLDIIFDGRNKNYGGYQLRTSYPKRMYRSGVFIFSFAMLFAAYSLWANRTKPIPDVAFENKVDTFQFINPILDLPKKTIEIPPAAPKTELNTKKLTIPDIVENEAVKPNDQLAKQEDLIKAVVGTSNSEGEHFGDASLRGDNKSNGGNGNDLLSGGGNTSSANDIIEIVEQMPEYPGGFEKLYAFLAAELQYPAQALNANKEGKVRLKFVVNVDGSIVNIQVLNGFGYGSEAESMRVVSKMPKWKPARNNGKAVRTWFYLPIAFSLK